MEQRVPAGWVLYDDSCGVCRSLVPRWGNTLRARGFGVAPLQSEWVRQRTRIASDDLMVDVRLLLADGREVIGADVYRHVMRRIWWAWPLYVLSVTPLVRGVFDRAYRAFADRRHQVSRLCRLPVD